MKPFLSENEYRETEFIVDIFRTGVGKILHSKLKERQKNKRNWVWIQSIKIQRKFVRIWSSVRFYAQGGHPRTSALKIREYGVSPPKFGFLR